MKNLFLVAAMFMVSCSGVRVDSKMAGGKILRLELKNPPLVGTTITGQRIYLGGFSGLRYLGRGPGEKLRFLTHTDRGPNAQEFTEGGKVKRPFVLSNYQPRLVFLLADVEKGTLEIEKEVFLKKPDGKNLTGFPQKEGQEVPVDILGKPLSLDPYGMDLEGIAQDDDGVFWMVEEYGPSILKFSADGKLKEVLKPGSGLPKILENRALNRGFEGTALFGSRLYAILQSPLKSENPSHLVRMIEVDTLGRRTLGQYVYPLEKGKSDKIGDIAAVGPREFYVAERGKSLSKVFLADLNGVSNLQVLPEKVSGMRLEGMSAEEMAEAKVVPIKKTEVLDLLGLGIREEKIEGIDLVNDTWIALVNDNDFGLEGGLDRATGNLKLKEEGSFLYLVHKDLWGKK